jgi:hypothetical protein
MFRAGSFGSELCGSASLPLPPATYSFCGLTPHLFLRRCAQRRLVGARLLLFYSLSPQSLSLLGVDHVPMHERKPTLRETSFWLGV